MRKGWLNYSIYIYPNEIKYRSLHHYFRLELGLVQDFRIEKDAFVELKRILWMRLSYHLLVVALNRLLQGQQSLIEQLQYIEHWLVTVRFELFF